jgi:hypothetical protein
MTINKNAVLDFFSGKSRENAAHALKMIEASAKEGMWIKGVSRSARAALNKSNEAVKFVKSLDDEHGGFGYDARGDAFWEACHQLRYGLYERAPKDVSVLDKEPSAAKLVAYYRAYREAFAPVVETMKRLDATRPPPVFTSLGASPTVTSTIESFEAVKVDVCPMEFHHGERVNAKTGKTEYYTYCILKWPPGTRFGTSRYHRHEGQCEACGHGIKNIFNWVPLVLTARDGTPKSLIVGRDCAETLFGVKLTGELEIVEG